MSQGTLRRTISHIGLLQIAIIILAVITALVHLDRGLMMSLLAPGGPPGGHFSGPPGGPSGGPPPGGHFAGPPGGGFPLLSLLPLTTLFYLNFVGYIVLVTALYLPLLRRYQRIIRWLLIVYAVVTIVAWFLISNASFNPLAYADKVVEVALITLLLIEDRQARLAKG